PPPPPSSRLSAITLNPTSVNGGTPSTGEGTLSGRAPSGGPVVPLSSSTPSVATVPASVTVAAASSVVAFQVTTTAVGSSTTIDISASQSGTSQQQTASLTVTPSP